MKKIVSLAAAVAFAALPAFADDAETTPANPELSEGAEMLSEGMKLFLRGLIAEGAEGWEKLVDWLDDLSLYEAPERLPNGDIIIRRKVPLEPGEAEDGGTDL